LINLTIFRTTFGIGGELLPSSPSGYTPALTAKALRTVPHGRHS